MYCLHFFTSSQRSRNWDFSFGHDFDSAWDTNKTSQGWKWHVKKSSINFCMWFLTPNIYSQCALYHIGRRNYYPKHGQGDFNSVFWPFLILFWFLFVISEFPNLATLVEYSFSKKELTSTSLDLSSSLCDYSDCEWWLYSLILYSNLNLCAFRYFYNKVLNCCFILYKNQNLLPKCMLKTTLLLKTNKQEPTLISGWKIIYSTISKAEISAHITFNS